MAISAMRDKKLASNWQSLELQTAEIAILDQTIKDRLWLSWPARNDDMRANQIPHCLLRGEFILFDPDY